MGMGDFLKWGIWLRWEDFLCRGGFLFSVVFFAEVAQFLSLGGGGCERLLRCGWGVFGGFLELAARLRQGYDGFQIRWELS